MTLESFTIDKSAQVKLTCEEIRLLNDLLVNTDEEGYRHLKNEISNLYDLVKHGNLNEFILKYKVREVLDKDIK